MKYFVLSDIHGSITSLDLALQHYSNEIYDGILLLGDILYHGPRNDLPEGYAPKEVIARLNAMKSEIICCVRGNCDAEVDQMVLAFPIMNDWVVLEDELSVLLTHGHHIEEHINNQAEIKIVLSGHTHIPQVSFDEQRYYCNPGSCSIPKGGFKKSYGVLTNHGFSVFTSIDNTLIMNVDWKK